MNTRRPLQTRSSIKGNNENRSLSFSKERRNLLPARYNSSSSYRSFGRDLSNAPREDPRPQTFRHLLFPKASQPRKFDAPKTLSGRNSIPRQKSPFENTHRKRPEKEAVLLRFRHSNSTLEQHVCSVDRLDVGNPQACAEYAKDISDMMHRTETEH